MFTENATKNGGFAIAFGQGANPGFSVRDSLGSSYEQLFAIPELTIPLLSGKLLWDLNPGVFVDFDCGVVPRSALVGEIYGTEGDINNPAQYRIGLGWEPSHSLIAAVTWSQALVLADAGSSHAPRAQCLGAMRLDAREPSEVSL